MNALETILITTHVAAGAAVLMSGPIAMLTPKGGNGHRQAGKFYFWGMFTIFATAMLLISLVRFNLFLLVIGIFSFYLAFSGYRVLRRKLPHQAGWIDWAAAVISVLAGVGLFGVGVKMLVAPIGSYHLALPILCMLFGYFTFKSGYDDILIFRKPNFDDKKWWKYHHIQAMMGSYIAAVTAFVVQSGDWMLPNWDFNWIFWLLPAAILTPLVSRWVRLEKAKSI